MSQNPDQIDNNNDKYRLLNNISPPIKLMIRQIRECKWVMQHNTINPRHIVEHRMKPSEPVFIRSHNSCPCKVSYHNKRQKYELEQSIFNEEKADNKQPSNKTEFPKVKVLQISFIFILIEQNLSEEVVLDPNLMSHLVELISHS